MKKIIFLSILFITLISCKKSKNDLKIELLTSQIVCLENVKTNDFLEAFYEPNKEYDSLSKNILHYKITNISNKRYYIMLNENYMGTREHNFYNEFMGKRSFIYNKIGFSMYKNDSVLDGNSTKMELLCGNSLDLKKIEELDTIVNDFLVLNKINKRYKIEFLNEENKSLQGYYLHPGETRYFTSVINLPYRNDQKWISNIDIKKPNLGSLSLQNDSVYTKKNISPDQQREIKENGYVIFDGIIYSNKVPVKLITNSINQ